MAAPKTVSVRDFNTSRFSQLADTSTANISDILARAEKTIESKIHRPLSPTSYVETFSPNSQTIYVRHRPIISVQGIRRGWSANALGVTLPSEAFSVNTEAGYIQFSVPAAGYHFEIEYTAGFDPLPEDLKEAVLIQAAYYAFQDLELYGSGDAKAPGILYLKQDIEDIVKQYRQINIAFTP